MGAKNSHSGLLRGIVSDTHTRALCVTLPELPLYPDVYALAQTLLFYLTRGRAALNASFKKNFAVQDFGWREEPFVPRTLL